ncbi:MAG TPA: hypothetical protein VKW78_23485 [Terriglobales bacterium]|nr:hypothetical protein [Terriglobales bacterium]
MKRLLLLALLVTNTAFGADEFKSVVKAVEAHYGIRHTHIPMMGLALKFSPDHQARSLKLAVFESGPAEGDLADLQQVVANSLGNNWVPFIRVWSRRDRESVVIYAKPSGSAMKLFIASLEPDESVVMSLDVDESSVRQWISDPQGMVHRSEEVGNEN